MSDQLALLNVPATAVSKATRNRHEIAEFKKRHAIYTHRAPLERKDHPWSALYFYPELKEEYGTPENAIAHYCRRLEEQRCLVTGETERQAIKALCEGLDIPCDL